jgi:hypothetical protein
MSESKAAPPSSAPPSAIESVQQKISRIHLELEAGNQQEANS